MLEAPTQPNLLLKRFQFKRSSRLLLPAEYNDVFAAGKRFSGALITIVAAQNNSARARIGMAIAKKQIKRAHERNRIKRHAREAFRQAQTLDCLAFVVMAKAPAALASNAVLRAELDALMAQAVVFFQKYPEYKPQSFHPKSKTAEKS